MCTSSLHGRPEGYKISDLEEKNDCLIYLSTEVTQACQEAQCTLCTLCCALSAALFNMPP